MRPQRISRLPIAFGLGMLFLATGCSASNEGDPSESAAPPADTQSPAGSEASTPPDSSGPAESSATDSPAEMTSAPGEAASSPTATTAALTLFYVAVGDGGQSGPEIGCGDSLVATETGPEGFTNQVEASMAALLADDDDEELGGSGLRNALAASDLEYVSSMVDGDVVTVELGGTISSGGTCDDPRIIGQLKHTAMVAAGTGQAVILVEGEKLEELLSAK